jgi:hypothetical protein
MDNSLLNIALMVMLFLIMLNNYECILFFILYRFLIVGLYCFEDFAFCVRRFIVWVYVCFEFLYYY